MEPKVKENETIAENACPHCGHRVRLHGGKKWFDGPASCETKRYKREFDMASRIVELYTCPECGGVWMVRREVECEEDVYRNGKPFPNYGYGCPECNDFSDDDDDYFNEWYMDTNEAVIARSGYYVKGWKWCSCCGTEYLCHFELNPPVIDVNPSPDLIDCYFPRD